VVLIWGGGGGGGGGLNLDFLQMKSHITQMRLVTAYLTTKYIKGSFGLGKMTLGIIPANENLYKLTNDSSREFLGVLPGEMHRA